MLIDAGENMSLPMKFQALSAIYFGLASAVMIQPAAAQSERPALERGTPPAVPSPGFTENAPNARQDHFQHPMLEERPSTELGDRDNVPNIQRRGMQEGTRHDGAMERNIVPSVRDDVLRDRQGVIRQKQDPR